MRNSYWLIFIIIIAAFLRLWNITAIPPGFYPDEAMYANNAVEAWTTGNFKVFYPENNGREGLWINIVSPFIAAFGHEPWVTRTIAALLGILTVLAVYLLTKELFKNEKLALFAAFLIATSFWHIVFSRIGFRAILAPLFLTWSIYFLIFALNKIRQKALLNKIILISVIAGLFYGLGFHTYIAYRATPLLILLIFALYWLESKKEGWQKEFFKVAGAFSLIAFIVFLPLGLYFLNNPADFFGRTSEISIFKSPTPLQDLAVNIIKTGGMFNFAGDQNPRHNLSGEPELFWPVGILFLVGIAVSLKRAKDGDFPSLFILGWLLITALPVIVSSEGIPHALRAIIMIPPVFMISALGGFWLYQKLLSYLKFATSPIVVLFSLLLILQAYLSYFILWARHQETVGAFNENYVRIARKLNELPREKPKVVIVNASGVPVRGIPMPAQTVMFLTDTFEEEGRLEKNFYYLTPDKAKAFIIPENAFIAELN